MSDDAFDLFKYALGSCEAEYKDLSETWRSLDTKAQGTGTLSGVFLAAVFAWTRSVPETFSRSDKVSLLICLLLLLVSVIASIWALTIREVAYPPPGEQTLNMVNDIDRAGVDPERISRLMRDQVELWRPANSQIRAHNERKAKGVKIGQVVLALAMLPIAIVSFSSILPW